MIRRATSASISGRAALGLALAALLLGGLTGRGLAIEHRQLPGSVIQLTTAVDAAANAVTCFQGVQDDLYIDAVGHFDVASVAAAQRRLDTCPVDAALRANQAISVPDQPLVEFGNWVRLRSAVVTARADMARAALDIRTTDRAMRSDLATHGRGQTMVVTYQAAYSDYLAAAGQDSLARVLLARLQGRGASGRT